MDSCINFWERSPNQDVLGIIAICSFLFLIAELIASFFSNSLSLFSNALVMSVDVFSYTFNMLAERAKDRGERTLFSSLTPLLCLTLLLLATLFSLAQAGLRLFSFHSKNHSNNQNPEGAENAVAVEYLYAFSSLNLALDLFALSLVLAHGRLIERSARPMPQLSLDTSLHSTDEEENEEDEFGTLDDNHNFLLSNKNDNTNDSDNNNNNNNSNNNDNNNNNNNHSSNSSVSGKSNVSSFSLSSCVRLVLCDRWVRHFSNLNMVSAAAHSLFALLRSLAVLLAAACVSLLALPAVSVDAGASLGLCLMSLLALAPLMGRAALEAARECSDRAANRRGNNGGNGGLGGVFRGSRGEVRYSRLSDSVEWEDDEDLGIL